MSKSTLRKALSGFEAPELRSLILDLYAKSKDAKEILDFFAEPDIARKTEEYKAILSKETHRYTRRAFRPRLPKLRAAIKRFRLLEPGDEAVAELMVHTSLSLVALGEESLLQDLLYLNIEKFLDETVDFLADHGLLEEYVPRLRRASGKLRRLRHGLLRNPLTPVLERVLSRAETLTNASSEPIV